jgi:hypothetical protein
MSNKILKEKQLKKQMDVAEELAFQDRGEVPELPEVKENGE